MEAASRGLYVVLLFICDFLSKKYKEITLSFRKKDYFCRLFFKVGKRKIVFIWLFFRINKIIKTFNSL